MQYLGVCFTFKQCQKLLFQPRPSPSYSIGSLLWEETLSSIVENGVVLSLWSDLFVLLDGFCSTFLDQTSTVSPTFYFQTRSLQ